MEQSWFIKYIEMIENAKLDMFIMSEDNFYYIASEDIEDGQVITAKFDVDGNLINIMADLSVNSLDQFINRCKK
jgi:hypothetical protein